MIFFVISIFAFSYKAKSEIKQQGIDALAVQLCDEDKNTLLTMNEKQNEFFGRMIGIEQIRAVGSDSLEGFVKQGVQMAKYIQENRSDWAYQTCETDSGQIACDDVVGIMSKMNFDGLFGIDYSNIEERVRTAMDEMNITSCVEINFYYEFEGKNEKIHNKYFVTDFGNGPQIFSLINNVATLGEGPKIIKPNTSYSIPAEDSVEYFEPEVIEHYSDASILESGVDSPKAVGEMMCKALFDGDMRVFLKLWTPKCTEKIASQSYEGWECKETPNLVDCLSNDFSESYEMSRAEKSSASDYCEVVSVGKESCSNEELDAIYSCGIDAPFNCMKVKLSTNLWDDKSPSNPELITLEKNDKWYLVSPDFVCSCESEECEAE